MIPELGFYLIEENGKFYSLFEITHVHNKYYKTHILYHVTPKCIGSRFKVKTNKLDNCRKITSKEVDILKLELI